MQARMKYGSVLALVTATVAAGGCAHEYVYKPAAQGGGDVAGRPAAHVQIPPEAPRGDVRLATFGITDVKPREQAQGEGATQPVRALHLRMVVADNSDRPWTVDTRELRLALPNRGDSRPAYASADQGSTPPIVTAPAGAKRTVDLFFPLPPDLAKADKLPEFDAVWTVHTDSRAVTERTPFERLEVLPPDVDYAWDYWGAPYWYDPLYPPGAWSGVALPPSYTGHPVVINRHAP
jgi:hypothetical protein